MHRPQREASSRRAGCRHVGRTTSAVERHSGQPLHGRGPAGRQQPDQRSDQRNDAPAPPDALLAPGAAIAQAAQRSGSLLTHAGSAAGRQHAVGVADVVLVPAVDGALCLHTPSAMHGRFPDSVRLTRRNLMLTRGAEVPHCMRRSASCPPSWEPAQHSVCPSRQVARLAAGRVPCGDASLRCKRRHLRQ